MQMIWHQHIAQRFGARLRTHKCMNNRSAQLEIMKQGGSLVGYRGNEIDSTSFGEAAFS